MDLLKGYGSSSEEEQCDTPVTIPRHQEEDEDDAKKKKASSSDLKIDILDFGSGSVLFERSVPRVRGNWAGHIFLKLDHGYQRKDLYQMTRKSLGILQNKLQTAGWQGAIVSHVPCRNGSVHKEDDSSDDEGDGSTSSTNSAGGLHVSLSRPFYLQEASIQSFVTDLRDRLSCGQPLTLVLGGSPHLLVNDDETRSFWCMPVTCTTPSLTRLIGLVDQVMMKYGQPTYYKTPLMHASIASVPGNLESLLVSSKMGSKKIEYLKSNKEQDSILLAIRHVHCTFGTTKEFSFDLAL